jgi:tetratricopeptide (TPR) repeat protein
MDEMTVLLRAIETLRPFLPDLVGEDWPDFQRQLDEYLCQLQLEPDRSPILRAKILSGFGRHRQAHQSLVELIAQFKALNRVVGLGEHAVQSTPPDSPELPGLLTNLGIGLYTRFARTGQQADLDEAIQAFKQAIKATPPDSPHLPDHLNNLGNALIDRFRRVGGERDLEEAVQVFRNATAMTPPNSPQLPDHLNNLGSALIDRFRRIGDERDMEGAIRVFQQAVEATPPGSPELSARLNNFGTSLQNRFQRTGQENDLRVAIPVVRSAAHSGFDPDAKEKTPARSETIRTQVGRGHQGSDTRKKSVTEGNVTRYVDIVCPRRVWVNTPRVSIVARLTVQRPAYSAEAEEMVLVERLPVQVSIEAPFFEILNPPRQEIAILADRDSAPIVFDLHPLHVGHTGITLDFFQNGNPVGVATVAIEVSSYEIADGGESPPARPMQFEPGLAPPDIVLHIAWNQIDSALHFTLIQDGGASWNDGFRPIPINGNPAAHTAEFYGQITSLVGAADPTVEVVLQRQLQIPFEDVDRRVKRLGQNLWRDLIPEEFKALYGRERERWRNRTMLIHSDDPHIPWELVWPYEAGAWEDGSPWCQTLRLTRWLRKDDRGNGNDKAPGRVASNSLALLAPSYSLMKNLTAAQDERDFLLDLIRRYRLRDVSPAPATWQTVMDLLEAGGYDWIHVASHGNFYPNAPDGDSAIWLQSDNALTPQHIAGMDIEGHLRQHRPAFFFNACEVGRQGWALTRIGGWANRLIGCGASLFVGPLWSVGDSSALTFATAFYQSLFSGETLGIATQKARAVAQQIGDPTYLAYSVYGHPNARVVADAKT